MNSHNKTSLLRLKVLGAVAAIFTFGAAQADPIVWGDNGHAYEYVATEGSMSWEDARAAALAAGGYLATITSADENAFIYALLTGSGGWIGGNDADSEGSFVWADGPEAGQAFTYLNWDSHEPNNCCNGEDYVQMTTREQGRWNDLDNNGTFMNTGYFVEYNSVPEPATLALLGLGLAGIGFAKRKKA